MQILFEVYAKINQDNLFLSHYYFIGQFLILSLFYHSISKSIFFKKTILVVIIYVLVMLFSVFGDTFNQNQFNILEVLFTSVPIIIFAIFFFIENMDKKRKYILINSGLFMYLISSTFLYSLGNLINSSNSLFKKTIWELNGFIYIILQILIFIEWYKNFRKPEVAQ